MSPVPEPAIERSVLQSKGIHVSFNTFLRFFTKTVSQ